MGDARAADVRGAPSACRRFVVTRGRCLPWNGFSLTQYSLGLHLPLKGLLNRLNVEPFVPITISPPLPFSLDGSSASGGGEGGNVVPPSYFEVFGDEEEGEKSAGKAGWSLGKKG